MSTKRKDLTIKEKKDILVCFDKLDKCSQREAALALKIPQPTLNKILKNRKEIIEHEEQNLPLSRKRKRNGQNVDVEESLLRWFQQARNLNVPVSNSILQEKSINLALQLGVDNFSPTIGWLTRWKNRNNIVFKKTCEEKKDADFEAAENYLNNFIASSNYAPNDIYNADETGLYYRALTNSTFDFKGNTVNGCKKQMQRLTILLVCNMTGTDKRRPLIIGKSKNPRCFRAVKTLPVDYYANSNAWMTSQIFTEFLRKWDKEIKKPRRILLILDNCTAHPNLQNLENIDLKFLPPNTTSLIQPLDQGIIKTMKTYYRKAMRNFIVETIDVCLIPASQIARKITVLEAIHMVVNAWDMVTSKCIINCFRKAGFSQIESDEEESQEVEFIDTNFENWILIDQDLPTFGALSDKDITDLQTKKEEINIDDDEDDDNEEANEDITQKDTRIILEKLKGAVQKYGDNDTFQLFQKLQVHTMYIVNK